MALGLSLLAAGCVAEAPEVTRASGPGVQSARYEADADVYPHRIMGSIREKQVLVVTDASGNELRVDLRTQAPGTHVFEDMAPRVVDATGNGRNDVVVIESDPQAGASLAIYSLHQGDLVKIAATPAIGQRFRWLAPVGVGDLDGNGTVDLAYVETPHLGKRLRVWSWAPGGLTEIAQLDGVTNHRIGEETIAGGLRDCGNGPEMIVASADWSQVVAVTLSNGTLSQTVLGPHKDRSSFQTALACK